MKKMFLCILLLGMGCLLFAETITMALAQIDSLKTAIELKEQEISLQLTELEKTDELFAPQSPFENSEEYYARLLAWHQKVNSMRETAVKDYNVQLQKLRNQVYETSEVIMSLGEYDANNQIYSITCELINFKDKKTFTIAIEKAKARELHQNWDSAIKKGILSIDVGDKVGLAAVSIITGDSADKYIKELFEISVVEDFVHMPQDETHHEYKDSNYMVIRNIYKIFMPNMQYYTTKVVDRKTGLEAKFFDYTTGGEHAFDLSPDGNFIAMGNSRIVNIYYVPNGKGVMGNSSNNEVSAVAYNPDGKQIAIASWNFDGKEDEGVIIYDALSLKKVKLVSTVNMVTDLLYCPNGKSLIIVTKDKASVINTSTKAVEKEFVVSGEIRCVELSTDGKYIAISSGYKCEIFDFSSKIKKLTIENPGKINFMNFSDDARYIRLGNHVYRTFLTYTVKK